MIFFRNRREKKNRSKFHKILCDSFFIARSLFEVKILLSCSHDKWRTAVEVKHHNVYFEPFFLLLSFPSLSIHGVCSVPRLRSHALLASNKAEPHVRLLNANDTALEYYILMNGNGDKSCGKRTRSVFAEYGVPNWADIYCFVCIFRTASAL